MSDEVTVVTNNHPRDLVSSYEVNGKLEAKLRKEFDYITDEEWYEECFNRFFCYKDQWYDVNNFEVLTTMWGTNAGSLRNQGWQGVLHNAFYSGILVKYAGGEFDQVVVGKYYV